MTHWRLKLFGLTVILLSLVVGLVARPEQPSGSTRFPHTLASFTTSLEGRTSGQKRNLALACQFIHGRVIGPGERFSFVAAVGPTTPERGFVKSNAYLDGETRPAYGGGCCQLASTVYNAALQANLEIVARSRHIWPVRSVPEGLDAAVNEETLDLTLHNRHSFPVRLRAQSNGTRVVVTFLAPQPLRERVEVNRRVLALVNPPQIVRSDPALPPGEVRRHRRGRKGCRVVVERIITRPNGTVHRESVSDDFYGPRNSVMLVGPGG